MVTITCVSSCRRVLLAVVGTLVCVVPSRAALVAHYTFDDVDTTITGDGLGDGNPDNNLIPNDPDVGVDLFGIDLPTGMPFRLELADASGNGHTALNTATQFFNSGPADYNGNGLADAADYTVWRDTLGDMDNGVAPLEFLPANGDKIGASKTVVDQADYDFWKANYGSRLGGRRVFGAATITGEPGKFSQSHKFFRDASIFQTDGGLGTAKEQANTTYYVDAVSGTDPGSNGAIPDGAAPRSFSLWFNEEFDLAGLSGSPQNKLFGYGEGFGAGDAFDIGLRDGGIQLRHFGGNIVYGSGYEFYQFQVESNGTPIPGVGADAGWHHLVVRVNDGVSDFNGVNVFLDNVQLSVASSTPGALTTAIATGENIDGFGIGTTSIENFGSAANGFQGWLDQFRIYDHALTAQEITNLFNETAGSGSISGFSTVPEPTALCLGSLVMIAVGFLGRRGLGGCRPAVDTMR